MIENLENTKQSQDNIIKCEFCGFRFQKCDGVSCDSCPINCKTIKCPNCGYEILPESKSYNFLENKFKKIKSRLFK
ncbi:hypothetical protein [Methanobrevibacter olleyae]|uniref:Uncharacterized protein n=1 Tax=Methanobrevibacter olleyae TaxID=294671 RepID=A0A126R000_METOL|nr:hypothetical protein [Methanobrevibacter olleyae]AMK15377.1 hypothetical protein YLM1_0820 [Methanobrevibacter olleyae]